MSIAMRSTRRAGVLLHPTSLPSGTLVDTPRWLDFMQRAGLSEWQMLPLGLPLVGRSPYQCVSAFAVNPALFPAQPVDLSGCAAWCDRQRHWLEDYARFITIKAQQGGVSWVAWPAPLRDRDPQALADFDAAYADTLRAVWHEQYRVSVIWQALRAQAAASGITLFGDMPIFVAHDSADVWAHRELFLLDASGEPVVVAGVPPDYFSATGQRWGNPHYNWDAMQADDFSWWRARLRSHFEWFDRVRIDHFRGLAAAWAIPASEPTAIQGEWAEAPGAALLQSIQDEMGSLPLVAEDLGIITPDVVALRQQFGLPGMAVLQFAFDHHADNPHKPANVLAETVYYIGTHDNDTTLGWWRNLSSDARQIVLTQLTLADDSADEDVLAAMIDTVLRSRANLVILSLQDILALGSAARMNIPGTEGDNWCWQFDWAMLTPERAAALSGLIQSAARDAPSPLHDHALVRAT
ncbi:MAG: 4-alpha-glucanotransferase [Thiobacillus sp.]